MKYTVIWEDRYEPGEYESEYGSLEAAIRKAEMVRDDGGCASVFDEDGNEY